MARPSGGGGGGHRPSGGGMARPSMPHGGGQMARPATPNISRPNHSVSRPALPAVNNKPKLPSSPNLGSRPSLGGFQPGAGARPNLPTTKPALPGGGNAGINRPNLKPPGDLKPIARPGGPSTLPGVAKPFPGGGNQFPGGNRPGGSGDIANRPFPGRPGNAGGPATLPSTRPGLGNIDRPATLPGRPGVDRPGIDRPGIGKPGPGGIGGIDRPGTLPGRPGSGLDRPGAGGGGEQWKPDRPWIGGGGNQGNWNNNNRPDRPWIGGNRPHIGDNTVINNNTRNNFINNSNNVNINNWNRPGWGVGGGNWNNGWNHDHWHDHWHDNYINNHYHGWYHGCWNGHYGNNWYAPWAVGVTAWGLGSLAGWGYGTSYYNPYYVASATPIYNYSQPVVVQNYYTTDDTGAQVPAAPQPTAEQLQPFDAGLAQFKAGDYAGALQKFDQALRGVPNDPVIHEVRALTLFALDRYQEAGAALNALLASSPGMDWTTMSGLYGDPNAYTEQLRKLEAYCRANQTDAAALFALTYQYLVIGQQDTAVTLLKHIVKLQPKDLVAARMLSSLEPEQTAAADPATPATPAPATPATPATPTAPAAADAPQTDLVGSWKATAGKTTIELSITEDSQYTWQAATADEKPVKLEGQLTTAPDAIILSNEAQGDMMGKVKSLGPDKFDFTIAGSPPNDPGLSFSRVK